MLLLIRYDRRGVYCGEVLVSRSTRVHTLITLSIFFLFIIYRVCVFRYIFIPLKSTQLALQFYVHRDFQVLKDRISSAELNKIANSNCNCYT